MVKLKLIGHSPLVLVLSHLGIYMSLIKYTQMVVLDFVKPNIKVIYILLTHCQDLRSSVYSPPEPEAPGELI